MSSALPAAFAASLRRAGVHGPATVAVALSGGPDSLALAALTARWQAAGGGRAAALVVDHGLRPESAAEAAGVAGAAERLGLQPRVLRVDWPGGQAPRTQDKMAAARGARYGLLVEACARLGRPHLLVAHHADDQVETFLVRMLHASGTAGLACMPLTSTALSGETGVTVVRPLLGARKRELEQYCAAQGLAYVVDPTNADVTFARNRLRLLLEHQGTGTAGLETAASPAPAGVVGDVLRLQRLCANAREAQEAAVAEVLVRAVLLARGAPLPAPLPSSPPQGDSKAAPGFGCRARWAGLRDLVQHVDAPLSSIPRFALCSVPAFCRSGREAARVAALSELLGRISGHAYLASSSQGRALAAALDGGRMVGKFTGGGCYVQPVPGSKGRLCAVVPLKEQARLSLALQRALALIPHRQLSQLLDAL